ncbi:OmpH family outer membrane protein [Sneathiella sp.]|uniref:OmpH family outer membrane protein n=1 Tax=Sneathiella sp. TaxID=1964365 RepID=UPI002FE3A8BC
MKSTLAKLIVSAFVMLPLAFQPAQAEKFEKASIAVVDMQYIMNELAVVRDVNAQIKQLEDKAVAELDAQENKLKEERGQIERQKSLISAEAYSDKQAAFNKKIAEFRTLTNDKAMQIQHTRVSSLNKVREQMLPVMREVIDEYGATIVLDVNEILFAEKPLNLTDAVVERLNKRLTKIKVELVPLKKS